MASRIGPRSVKDATRFTSTMPHATSKSASAGAAGGRAPPATPKPSLRLPGETPEQRVRRLRQAHIAAQKAQVSRTDRVIDASRRFLDVAHRWTVGGIVVFTAVAGVVSVYSVWDMLQYNRARRAEWVEAQKKLEADSLAAARIAYLKGTATDEQILLVEEANREARETGVKLPPLLAPAEHRTHFEEHVKPTFSRDAADGHKEGKGVLGVLSGLFGGSTAAQETPSGASTPLAAGDGVVQAIEAKAKDVWETEKQNQLKGGSLDQLGLDIRNSEQKTGKRGWWPW
ncbi:uncharacterized protein MAM_00615 [Metarhizium album ARSEF 1941]|uniref:Cytochrome oxidase c assembly domain-containing protein n=1 Tax=Metarhizium album (strain ARSEF 1941) TaxID=1081103 RepID=A0A0B2X5F5_METAS|nr:uncharacterized protein MAM_00615 [Metarhizium album ARSEF 1941]KHO01614.1 hypothetical protein MAM_00615 [Metarhizium album ARSEF 1941]